MKEKGEGMFKFIRALSIANIVISILSQLLLICFAVLMFAFGNNLGEGDFRLTEIFSDIMFVFIMTFLADIFVLLVLLIFRQIKYDKIYRRYFRIIDVMYFIFAAVLPIYFWQMWLTYDFRVRALIFSLIIQFMILLNSFFNNRYLRQYIAAKIRKTEKKKDKTKKPGPAENPEQEKEPEPAQEAGQAGAAEETPPEADTE